MMICQDFNYLEKCQNCDIALSVHKNPLKDFIIKVLN